jgi:glycosyltransferase involved in cell wall biosynthesis
MRILHSVLSDGFYGSERYCLELAAGQARAGHEVALLITDGSDFAREYGRIAPATGDGALRMFTVAHWLPNILVKRPVKRILDTFRPDVVHTHLDRAVNCVGEQARALGIPHVATLHTDYDEGRHAACDGMICIATWQRDALPPCFAGAVTVVPNWLPRSISQALAALLPEEAAAMRGTLRADASVTVFGSAGRLLPEKGMDRLIRCFRAAFPLGTEPVRIVIAGDGPLRSDIEELCGRDARVFLMGMQSNIAAVYRSIDVYVSAARFEPFGLAIIEAMAAGCPMILTRTQGPSEYVTDPRVKWAAIDDEVTLVDHMRAAVPSAHGRLTYDLSRFTPEDAFANIEAFYGEVIGRRSRLSA